MTATFDAAGRQLTMQDVTGVTTFTWDARSMRTAVQNGIGKALTYSFDGAGNRLTVQSSEGLVSYAWDPQNRLTGIVNPYAERTTLTLDALDRPLRALLGNGVSVSHTFDAAGRATVLGSFNSSGAALAVYSATYDQTGNRLTVLELDGTRVAYSYDQAYQLVNEQRSGANAYDTTWTFDRVGNRTLQNASGQLTTASFNPANELTLLQPPTGQPTTSTWDAMGNVALENAGGALTTYGWHTENYLLTVAAGTAIETYSYSADGMRERKVNSSGTVNYVRDGENVLIETDGSLVTQALYTDLPGIWGGKFSLHRSGASRFYLPDYQGNTRQLTDATAAVTDTLLTDAWGREIVNTGSTVNPFEAFGQWGYYRDQASRLYVQARHLRVDLGRWVSRDPIGFWAFDWNLYRYCSNNVVWFVDPSGFDGGPGKYAFCDNCRKSDPGWVHARVFSNKLWGGAGPGPKEMAATKNTWEQCCVHILDVGLRTWSNAETLRVLGWTYVLDLGNDPDGPASNAVIQMTKHGQSKDRRIIDAYFVAGFNIADLMGISWPYTQFPRPPAPSIALHRKRVLKTLAHELGHQFGLPHYIGDIDNLMYPTDVFGTFPSGTKLTEQQCDDARKIIAQYFFP